MAVGVGAGVSGQPVPSAAGCQREPRHRFPGGRAGSPLSHDTWTPSIFQKTRKPPAGARGERWLSNVFRGRGKEPGVGTDLSPGQGLEAASTPERPEAPALQAAGVPSPVLSPYPAWFPQVVGGKGRPVQGVRAPAGVQVECGSRVSRGRPGCPGAPWASAPERFHQFIDLWGDGVVSGQGGAGPQVECGDSASRCCSRRRCHLSLSCVGPSVSGVQAHRRRAGEFLTSQTSGVCLLKTTAFLSGRSQRPGPEKLVTTFAWFPSLPVSPGVFPVPLKFWCLHVRTQRGGGTS